MNASLIIGIVISVLTVVNVCLLAVTSGARDNCKKHEANCARLAEKIDNRLDRFWNMTLDCSKYAGQMEGFVKSLDCLMVKEEEDA